MRTADVYAHGRMIIHSTVVRPTDQDWRSRG